MDWKRPHVQRNDAAVFTSLQEPGLLSITDGAELQTFSYFFFSLLYNFTTLQCGFMRVQNHPRCTDTNLFRNLSSECFSQWIGQSWVPIISLMLLSVVYPNMKTEHECVWLLNLFLQSAIQKKSHENKHILVVTVKMKWSFSIIKMTFHCVLHVKLCPHTSKKCYVGSPAFIVLRLQC